MGCRGAPHLVSCNSWYFGNVFITLTTASTPPTALVSMAAVMIRQVKDYTERLAQSRQFNEFTQLSNLITRQKVLSRLDNT
jgi:hypothetical protein